jgi:hypothetical protein
MDAVTDLAARAAAFIGIIQQYELVNCDDLSKREHLSVLRMEGKKMPALDFTHTNRQFVKRVFDLIWINNESASEEKVVTCFVNRAHELLNWTWRLAISEALLLEGIKAAQLPTPDEWRQAISRVLYKNAEERIILARAISYLPIQLVLASGGAKYKVLEQRVLQEWDAPVQDLAILISQSDLPYSWENRVEEATQQNRAGEDFNAARLSVMFKSEKALLEALISRKVPLSFEQISGAELDEIQLCRDKRKNEDNLSEDESKQVPDFAELEEKLITSLGSPTAPVDPTAIADPVQRAQAMELHALAFSGGGIRSATFNLGILQGFAKAGLISRFDYLSTVSGGGYIGS